MVEMTRMTKSAQTRPSTAGCTWALQDAKARFSELVRRAQGEGPQHVTVHGREGVVVVSAEEFRRLWGGLTGAALVAAMAASPHRDTEIAPARAPMPVRDVAL